MVADGETVEARAVVLDEFERKGHRFVTLDVAIDAPTAGPMQRITHTAIYQPRRLSADPTDLLDFGGPGPPMSSDALRRTASTTKR